MVRAEPTPALDDSNPPFFKWFTDGKLNASYNCLDRHVEAGLGDRVAFHWRGEEGEERDVTYADLHRDVQRLANVLKERGVEAGDVVGIYLPMIPEVVVAMLACARIGAPHNVVFGGFSPDGGQGADAVLRGEGADHGRRRPAQGQGAPRSSRPSTTFLGEVPSIETVIVVRNTGAEVEMTEGRDVYYDEALEAAEAECARRRARRRAPAVTSSTPRARPRSRRASCTRTGGY